MQCGRGKVSDIKIVFLVFWLMHRAKEKCAGLHSIVGKLLGTRGPTHFHLVHATTPCDSSYFRRSRNDRSRNGFREPDMNLYCHQASGTAQSGHGIHNYPKRKQISDSTRPEMAGNDALTMFGAAPAQIWTFRSPDYGIVRRWWISRGK